MLETPAHSIMLPRRTLHRLGRALALAVLAGAGQAQIQPAGQTIFDFPFAPPSLDTLLPVPLPDDLGSFVTDMGTAVRLGKALFWDVQVGSDGKTACATCHYHAGVTTRSRNTLAPGANGHFDAGGPNAELVAGDFPLHRLLDRNTRRDLGPQEILQDRDDIVGATGVHGALFDGVTPGPAPGAEVDAATPDPDPTFQVNGINTRRVTGRQAPTVIGANFLFRLFWDGRANHFFNGRNPWGDQDPSATVLERLPDGGLGEVVIRLNNAATASQAVGPPLSEVEMSWLGRDFMELGRKMIDKVPLAQQHIDPTDSVLGPFVDPSGVGVRADLRYRDWIEQAFDPRWWISAASWTNPDTGKTYSQIEANFSLFFGLAILCYESTLVPNDTPYDDFARGDSSALTQQQKLGLEIAQDPFQGACLGCHTTPMFAGATTALLEAGPQIDPITGLPEIETLVERMPMQTGGADGRLVFDTSPGQGELQLDFDPFDVPIDVIGPDGTLIARGELPGGYFPQGACSPAAVRGVFIAPVAFPPFLLFDVFARYMTDGACGARFEVQLAWPPNGFVGPGDYTISIGGIPRGVISMPEADPLAVYDLGFYNIGIRPTSEDLGNGADGPFGPLSIAKGFQLGLPMGFPQELVPPVAPGERLNIDGTFKAPTLRNVELTGPYMHNGGMATLEEVIDFYSRGSDFFLENQNDLDPEVRGIFGISPPNAASRERKAALVAFLRSLTDRRLRIEAAPFDHPELPLPASHGPVVTDDGTGRAVDVVEVIPATGAAGGAPLRPFHEELPASVTVHPADLALERGVPGRLRSGRLLRDDQFAVVLDKRPSSNVIVRVTVSDPLQASVDPAILLFTSETWNDYQVVTVTATPEAPAGPADVAVRLGLSSLDLEFAGLAAPEVQVHVEDPPPPPLLSLTPVQAGVVNTLTLQNATPEGLVVFAWGFQPGPRTLVLSLCPEGIPFDLLDPQPLGFARATGGTAALQVLVPPTAAGLTVHLQALDLAGCRASQRLPATF